MERIHVIPVGGIEPLHAAHEECWCKPLLTDEAKIAIHHAKDLRELKERQDITTPELRWVQIKQLRV